MAIGKGLNPVLYIEKESDLCADIHNTAKSFFTDQILESLDQNGISILNLFRYMKNYQGDLERESDIIKNYRYSDEREWRYVPSSSEIDLVVPLDDYKNDEQKSIANRKLAHLRLEFTPDDITYIIINDESEIIEFINILKNAKGNEYTLQQVDRLITRILTTEQIISDI